jgi:hypothetical protein
MIPPARRSRHNLRVLEPEPSKGLTAELGVQLNISYSHMNLLHWCISGEADQSSKFLASAFRGARGQLLQPTPVMKLLWYSKNRACHVKNFRVILTKNLLMGTKVGLAALVEVVADARRLVRQGSRFAGRNGENSIII